MGEDLRDGPYAGGEILFPLWPGSAWILQSELACMAEDREVWLDGVTAPLYSICIITSAFIMLI